MEASVADQKDRDKENLEDYEGGYGGGRQRIEQMHEHAFGERGWSTRSGDDSAPAEDAHVPRPEGVHETHGPGWQDEFIKENSDKYGQSGGKPIGQRGSTQTTGGVPDEEQVGDARNVSPRGTYGIRETEKWPDPDREEETADQSVRDKK
jgi:hypothetical protein